MSNPLAFQFNHLWQTILEPKAKDMGLIDGDMPKVRSAVKNMMVSAGWSDVEGKVDFISAEDLNAGMEASLDIIKVIGPTLVASRRVTHRHGFTPTKTQIVDTTVSPVVQASVEPVELTSTQSVTAAFHPEMGKVGDRCPKCSGSMEPVALVNERGAIMCQRDRVVTPLPIGYSVR